MNEVIFTVNYSSIRDMLELCKKLKQGSASRQEIEDILNHNDYRFEFSRYRGRVEKDEFAEYLLNINRLTEEDIQNIDLKAHHGYFVELMDNLEFYIEKSKDLNKFSEELFRERICLALKGLPEGLELPPLDFIFTIGIGRSFGYVHGNGMHFDFLQLIKDNSIEGFCSIIAHEVHHVGINIIHESLDLNSISLEALFYLNFSVEGLAVKYCNNAEGFLSKSIYKGHKNIGLDSFTWRYLNGDFFNTMEHFKETVIGIRCGSINTKHQLDRILDEYWMNPYIEGQGKDEIPRLKHFRLYSFGNDIWGIIHDCFGKEIVYKTLKNPDNFAVVFNKALEILDREEFKI